MSSPNQVYREDLRAHGECRDCEAPLLASERNYSRGSVYRAKRNARKTEARGAGTVTVQAANARGQAAKLERIRIIGYDDSAGDREAVRRRRAA